MIDFVLRDCGHNEYLPLIVVTDTRRELYRGSRHGSAAAALFAAETVWQDNGTGNIAEFKKEHGL